MTSSFEPKFSADLVSIPFDYCICPNVDIPVSQGDGYVETTPLRLFYKQEDPNDPTSRQFTRVKAVSRQEWRSKAAQARKHLVGHLKAYIEPSQLLFVQDVEAMLASSREDRRVERIASKENSSRVGSANLAPVDALPMQTVEMPAYLDLRRLRATDPSAGPALEAKMPEFSFNLPMDNQGKIITRRSDYIEGWAIPTLPAGDPDCYDYLKITVRFECRLRSWSIGWPTD